MLRRRQQRQQRKRADGEGSIFRRANGVWVALTPSPERKAFTSRESQAEAVRRRNEYLKRTGDVSHVSARQLLSEYLRDWLSTKRVSERTYDGYSVIIELHIVPHIGSVQLGRLTPQHIQRALDAAGSQWTRAKVYQLLNAALGLAAKWDVLAKNPADKVDPPAVTYPPVTPLADEHYYALIEHVAGDKLEALWLLMLSVGVRRGEAIAVSKSNLIIWSTVDDEGVTHWHGTVTIVRSLQRVRGALKFLPVKTAMSNRTLSVPEPVVLLLLAHLAAQKEERLEAGEDWTENDLVFCTRIGTPLEPRNVTRRWGQIITAAGIPKTKLKDGTRHTVISMLLRDRTDIYAVQAMAGHAQPSTTTGIYGHLMTAPSVVAEKMAGVLNRRPTK